MKFWEDGPTTKRDYRMPEVTAKERVAVWDAVAVYVQQQLLLHKVGQHLLHCRLLGRGVRIPTFGSFNTVSEWIVDEDETIVVKWPAFRLARNLVETRNLMHNKEYLPGVLLIDGTRVQMKFYYNFLEKINGKGKLEKVLFKVPGLMDMLVSRVAPVASLTSSGRVVVFPKFQGESVPKPPPQKSRKASEAPLPPCGQHRNDKVAAISFAYHMQLTCHGKTPSS
ncbi:hypothetical protein ASZ78_009503 [Callipepla squamata]|uniref:CCDC81 HU domain-containing protein n=1 Tax=Callipepla squamata TaxID=9009 RepID=A0A226MF90_CALSU|nr:hypothetical protein ASZ78_009503 [Callipepla squamata]